jgi:dephospho-CoA kinase
MGIAVEFNPDLALRNIREYSQENSVDRRELAECIPNPLIIGEMFEFLKKGQRNYWLFGEIPLLETDGKRLSLPLASIVILEATHILRGEEIYTKGIYTVVEIFPQTEIHFNGFAKI